MAKSKREEASTAEGDYEFKLPAFDERAFIRREVLSARASFLIVGLGVAAGVVAGIAWWALPRPDRGGLWLVAWIPLVLSLAITRPLLKNMQFPDEIVAPKAMLGNYFMQFFTGLAVWILAINALP